MNYDNIEWTQEAISAVTEDYMCMIISVGIYTHRINDYFGRNRYSETRNTLN